MTGTYVHFPLTKESARDLRDFSREFLHIRDRPEARTSPWPTRTGHSTTIFSSTPTIGSSTQRRSASPSLGTEIRRRSAGLRTTSLWSSSVAAPQSSSHGYTVHAMSLGATWDHPTFRPHITLSYHVDTTMLRTLELRAPHFQLRLDPAISEPLNENWTPK